MKKHRVILAACIAAMLSAVLISSAQQRNSTAAYLSFLSPVSVNEFTYAGGGEPTESSEPDESSEPSEESEPDETSEPDESSEPTEIISSIPEYSEPEEISYTEESSDPEEFSEEVSVPNKEKSDPPTQSSEQDREDIPTGDSNELPFLLTAILVSIIIL